MEIPEAGGSSEKETFEMETSFESIASQRKMARPGKKAVHRDRFMKEVTNARCERSALIKDMLEKHQDPIDAFFQGIAATVKTLPSHLQIKGKRLFNQMVCDLEEENLNP